MSYDIQDAMAGMALDPRANWRIDVRIERDPGAISRVLDPLARQGLTPDRLAVTTAGGELDLTLELSQVGLLVTTRLCALLGNMPAVRCVKQSRLSSAILGDGL
jgi:hypothetical protein